MNKKSVYRNVKFCKHPEALNRVPVFDNNEKDTGTLKNGMQQQEHLSDQMINQNLQQNVNKVKSEIDGIISNVGKIMNDCQGKLDQAIAALDEKLAE